MRSIFNLSDEARAILSRSIITAETVALPGQLDRNLYLEINKALVGAGGRWDRKRGCHVFLCDPRQRLGLTVENGKALNGAWTKHQIGISKQAGQKLDGDNLQEVLDSGTNAARKGRQQYFTPPEFARALMLPLPIARMSFVDLTMGAGALLQASGSHELYGCDIDSRLARKPSLTDARWNCVNADLTRFYPLLQEIGWQFDLCGLNPPFSVRWHRENLAALAESECDAVKVTFGPKKKGIIDSTLATLLIALDRMTERGEGFMICPATAAQKILDSPIGAHVWFQLQLPQSKLFAGTSALELSILYFARGHHNGPELIMTTGKNADAHEIGRCLSTVAPQRALYRKGLSIYHEHDFSSLTERLWKVAAQEYRDRHSTIDNRKFNIWLRPDGKIGRHLTPFQTYSGRIPPDKAEALNRLQGQTPMALVVQRATRTELLAAVKHCSLWRVDPGLVTAVERAIAQYHSQRAPFYALNEVQRLGYLDEEDTIICKRDFPGFATGDSYQLSSETIDVERPDVRTNLMGEFEDVTYHGKELAFYIIDADKKPHKFSGVLPEHESQKPVKDGKLRMICPKGNCHDIETLIRYFVIPEVPDVAMVYPDRYKEFVNRIKAIEAKVNRYAA